MYALYFLDGESNPFCGVLFGPFEDPEDAMKFADVKFGNQLAWEEFSDSWTADDGDGEGCFMVQKLTKDII